MNVYPQYRQGLTAATEQLDREWATAARWKMITRPYSVSDVVRFRNDPEPANDAVLPAQQLWTLLSGGAQEQLSGDIKDVPTLQTQTVEETYGAVSQLVRQGSAAIAIGPFADSENAPGTRMRYVRHLVAARFAADTVAIPLVLIARIQIDGLTLDNAINWAYACAPYAEVIVLETRDFEPDLASQFAAQIRRLYPSQKIAYKFANEAGARDNAAAVQELGAAGFCLVTSALLNFHAAACDGLQFAAAAGAQTISDVVDRGLLRGASSALDFDELIEFVPDPDLV